jgi:hypothetical protein
MLVAPVSGYSAPSVVPVLEVIVSPCKPAQSSTRIRRGDRELGFVAPRSAWPGRMGPVEFYTRRSHARCREIAVRRWRRFPPSFESDQDEV